MQLLAHLMQVQKQHRQRPSAMFLHLSAGHEETMKTSRSYDLGVYRHLLELQHDGLLRETAVLIVGDHGTQTGSYYATVSHTAEHPGRCIPCSLAVFPLSPPPGPPSAHNIPHHILTRRPLAPARLSPGLGPCRSIENGIHRV